MPISLVCDSCGATLNIGDQFAGRKVKCPKCTGVLAVPAAMARSEGKVQPRRENKPEQARAAPSRRDAEEEAAEDRPVRKRRRDEDDDRPRRKRKSSNKGLIIGLSVGGVLLIAGAVLLVVLLRGGGSGSGSGGGSIGGSSDTEKATEDNFDQIKQRMSREDVEKILGKGERVSRAEVFRALHDPVPKGVGNDTTTLKWKNKNEIILLELDPQGVVMFRWFVRDQGNGTSKYKLLGFPKLN